MRAFIAIPIERRIVKAIEAAAGPLREVGADIKWVEPDNLHVTLKFLGEMEGAAVAALRADLREAATRHRPFDMAVAGFGMFPRVVWVGCEGPLAAIAADVERVAEARGVAREDRPFAAHATIGRVKGRHKVGEVRRLIESMKPPAFGVQRVAGFTLLESVLRPQGPVYSPVEAFEF